MATPLEKELKYALQPREYRTLIRRAGDKARPQELINYYLDDPTLTLRRNSFGLRVRLVDGRKAVLTLKQPAPRQARGLRGFTSRREYESPLKLSTAKSLLHGRKALADLNVLPARLLRKRFSPEILENVGVLGKMRTVRTLFTLPNGRHPLTLEIDRCRVFDQSFFELEVETDRPRQADRAVRAFLREQGVRCRPAEKSKLSRFLEAWGKRGRS